MNIGWNKKGDNKQPSSFRVGSKRPQDSPTRRQKAQTRVTNDVEMTRKVQAQDQRSLNWKNLQLAD